MRRRARDLTRSDADDLAKNRMPHENFFSGRRRARFLRRYFRFVLFLRLERVPPFALALVPVRPVDRRRGN